ncbi:MAG: NifB/NifX family molybdenum-iron cluster-binding protein [Anaerotignaceae bacterium]
MKIAIPTQDGAVFQHFGQSKEFTIFDVQDHKILDTKKIDTSDSGHGALAVRLKENDVKLLICGGIGGGAISALTENCIEVLPGVDGLAQQAIIKYLSGEKIGNLEARCNHHGEDHVCHH